MDKILLMFSGGIDSVGAMYKLLTLPEYASKKLHVHYIYMDNGSAYLPEAQKDAVQKIFKAFGFIGISTNTYEYTTSTHVFPYKGYAWDSDVAYFMARVLINNDSDIKYMALGVNKDDRDSPSGNPDIWTTVREFDMMTEKKINRIYPVEQYTKKEIIEFLPIPLLQTSWSCRTPIPNPDGFTPCGRCKSCRAREAAQK